MITCIPVEILDQICPHLSTDDYYQLVSASQAFKKIFIPYMYKEVIFNTLEQAEAFIKTTSYHRYVRRLTILQYGPNMNELKTISDYFPNLESINACCTKEIAWEEFDQPLHYLTSFACSRQLSKASLVNVLSNTPRLQKLDFVYFKSDHLDFSFFDTVHSLCPNLIDLSITCSTWKQSISLKEQELAQPANTLKRLNIRKERGENQHQAWLMYIGNKYPNIVSLKFEHEFFLYDRDMPELHLAFYSWFLSKCQHLVSFEWKYVLPNAALIQQLKKMQRRFCRLVLYDPRAVDSGLLKPNCLPFLNDLKILLPQWKPFNSLISIISKAFPRLQHLSLEGGARTYHIDMVLDQFLHLTSLEIQSLRLVVTKGRIEQQRRSAVPHPLKKIRLSCSRLFDEVFDYISVRCFELKQLTLDRVRFKTSAPKARIYLQQQELQRIELNIFGRFVNHKTTQMQLLHVQHKNRSSWYRTTLKNHYAPPIRPFKELDIRDIETLASLLSHDINPLPSSRQLLFCPSSIFNDYDLLEVMENGYLEIVCQSIDAIYIDKKRLI
ncbi:hypothetical protein A0J61_04708 [Choanephora cucurbitarum]|uniref:F-box domain-containing protein n=1 Tax=Choanephora cucurbitarum TaxID=101091 RepID=A0A1C7NFB7_9FUNG|nr:hypothetical protein A0J61_04708 [Choanephora cucurbitarum]